MGLSKPSPGSTAAGNPCSGGDVTWQDAAAVHAHGEDALVHELAWGEKGTWRERTLPEQTLNKRWFLGVADVPPPTDKLQPGVICCHLVGQTVSHVSLFLF